MKLTRKQKEFKRLHKYTIVNMNNVTVKLKNDGTCIPALPDEIGTFIMFTPKTFIGEIKKDFVNIGEIIRFEHAIFRKWQFKVLCDSKSKLHNGRRFYVLTDLNGDYRVVSRDDFKMLKNRNLISKKATFLDLMKESVHISPVKRNKLSEANKRLDSEVFENIMYEYRRATLRRQDFVIEKFKAVKKWIINNYK